MNSSVAALVCVEFSRLAVGTSISLPHTVGEVTVSTAVTASAAEVRRGGTPASVGLGVFKGGLTIQYRKTAKRVEIDFSAGPSAVLDFKVIARDGSQLNAKSFSRPGTYVFASSNPTIKTVRATSNNEALIERVCFGD